MHRPAEQLETVSVELREDLELLEVLGQLEEAVVRMRHGEVDADETRGKGGRDAGEQCRLPHREPLLPPHLLPPPYPLAKNPGSKRGGGEEEEEEREMEFEKRKMRAFFGSLSSLLFPLSLSSSVAFLGEFIWEGREVRIFSLSLFFIIFCLFLV